MGTGLPARTLLDSKHMEIMTLLLVTPFTELTKFIIRTNIRYIQELHDMMTSHPHQNHQSSGRHPILCSLKMLNQCLVHDQNKRVKR